MTSVPHPSPLPWLQHNGNEIDLLLASESQSVDSVGGQGTGSDDRDQFLDDVKTGLAAKPKRLSSKYFYDRRGSLWFDEICRLPEYYPTRTELQIMRRHSGDMARRLGPNVRLVEWGSGSSWKTRLLLEHLADPHSYIPIDVSGEHLQATAEGLREDYSELAITPIVADFTERFDLPDTKRGPRPERTCLYFPGSTIGNFEPEVARRLVSLASRQCGPGGAVLIGVDLQKDVRRLIAAYDDSRGVTANFNLNLLRRINRELGGDFDLEQFSHDVRYDTNHHRIEMHLRSEIAQHICVDGSRFDFECGETICTEFSHKYTVAGFNAMAQTVGVHVVDHWTDDASDFAVLMLERSS